MPHDLALLDAETGEPQRARAGYEEALVLAHEPGDKSAHRAELHELATLDNQSGEVEQAQARFEEALWLARELQDASAVALEYRSLDDLDNPSPPSSVSRTSDYPRRHWFWVW